MSACEYCTARTGHREGCTETLPGEPTLDDLTPAEQCAALLALDAGELLEQALTSLADAAMWSRKYAELQRETARLRDQVHQVAGQLEAARQTAAEWRARESVAREQYERLYRQHCHALGVAA